jgi:hypothetical protein
MRSDKLIPPFLRANTSPFIQNNFQVFKEGPSSRRARDLRDLAHRTKLLKHEQERFGVLLPYCPRWGINGSSQGIEEIAQTVATIVTMFEDIKWVVGNRFIRGVEDNIPLGTPTTAYPFKTPVDEIDYVNEKSELKRLNTVESTLVKLSRGAAEWLSLNGPGVLFPEEDTWRYTKNHGSEVHSGHFINVRPFELPSYSVDSILLAEFPFLWVKLRDAINLAPIGNMNKEQYVSQLTRMYGGGEAFWRRTISKVNRKTVEITPFEIPLAWRVENLTFLATEVLNVQD